MAEENRSKGALLFVAGALIGAVAGILLAPKAGKETREDIAEWLKARRAKGGEFLSKVKEPVIEKKDQLVAAARAAKEAYKESRHNGHERETVNS